MSLIYVHSGVENRWNVFGHAAALPLLRPFGMAGHRAGMAWHGMAAGSWAGDRQEQFLYSLNGDRRTG